MISEQSTTPIGRKALAMPRRVLDQKSMIVFCFQHSRTQQTAVQCQGCEGMFGSRLLCLNPGPATQGPHLWSSGLTTQHIAKGLNELIYKTLRTGPDTKKVLYLNVSQIKATISNSPRLHRYMHTPGADLQMPFYKNDLGKQPNGF